VSEIAGVTSHLGIEYAQIPGFRPLELDLYLPGSAAGPVPVVVHVHGGGWRRGSRRHPLPALGDGFYQGLAASGIAVAAVDYRLSGEARYPAAVDDVRAAVAWARSALPGYGVTPGPLVLWGDSAGGHLALLVALSGTEPGNTGSDNSGLHNAGVDGVVAWFPVTDLTAMPGDDPGTREALFLGAPPSRVPDLARAASPITHVHAGAPPVLLMHGDSDTMVPADQSIRLAAALTDAGATATLELVPGASHFWDGAADVPGIVARSARFVRSLAPAPATGNRAGRPGS
jgi:acetyl esterase/lipase